MVSIIIPCFNGERVLNCSINSVYSQDYDQIELIIVDDGSTDNSKTIIKSWEYRFSQKGYILKYVFQVNQGLGGAINTGLKYVSGRYLCLLDADDYLLPFSISKKALFLENHPDYAGVRTNGWMIRDKRRTEFVSDQKEKDSTDYFNALLFSGAANWAGSYMIRTSILFDFYPDKNIYPSRYGQNMQLLLPVAYKRKFGFIDEPLMTYVVHEGSLSQAASTEGKHEKDNDNFYGYLDIYHHMINLIIKEPKERNIYERVLDSWQYRHECNQALRNKNLKKLKDNLLLLKSTGWATINDKILYYSLLDPIRAFIYRIIRRLKR